MPYKIAVIQHLVLKKFPAFPLANHTYPVARMIGPYDKNNSIIFIGFTEIFQKVIINAVIRMVNENKFSIKKIQPCYVLRVSVRGSVILSERDESRMLYDRTAIVLTEMMLFMVCAHEGNSIAR